MQPTSLAALGILLTVNVGSVVVIFYTRPKTEPGIPQPSLARKNDEVMAAILGAVGIMALAIVYSYSLLGLSPIYLVIIAGFLSSAVSVYTARKSGRRVPVPEEAK